MVCPKCQHAKSNIYNSRQLKKTNQTWRRRRCAHCGFTYSTREYIEADDYLQVDIGDKKVPYSRAHLLLSLAKACEHQRDKADIAFHLLATVEHTLLTWSKEGVVSKEFIIKTCLEVLQRFDTKAFLAYLATYPDFQDQRDIKKLLGR